MNDNLEFKKVSENKDLVANTTFNCINTLFTKEEIDNILVAEINPKYMDGIKLCEHYNIDIKTGVNCLICECKRGENKVEILGIIYILLFLIAALVVYSVAQIRMAGMKVKDFTEFIQANQILDDLYEVSKRYERMEQKEKLVFLMEAEKVFAAFDKVPNMLWEDEYQKYSRILDIYRDIKMVRWNEK